MSSRAQSLFDQAVTAHTANQWGEAERLYRQTVAQDPANKVAWSNMGALLGLSGRFSEALDCFSTALEIDPAFPDALGNVGMCLRDSGQLDESVMFMQRAMATLPNSLYVNKQYFTSMIAAGRGTEVLAQAERIYAVLPEDDDIARAVLHARFNSNDEPGATEVGQKLMEMRDERLCREADPALPSLVGIPDRPFASDVVSFSLYGSDPIYCQGAIENAQAMPVHYPGWQMWVYHDDTVPSDTLETLTGLGVRLIRVTEVAGRHRALFWRFRVADDPTVRRFVVRDCDSRINLQEAAAVAEWEASGLPVHVMHDHILHLDMILAGMWGGYAGIFPGDGLMGLIDQFVVNIPRDVDDQMFLAQVIWPMVAGKKMHHSSYYQWSESRPFPAHARLERPDHVGACIKQLPQAS